MKPIRISHEIYRFAQDFSSNLFDGKTERSHRYELIKKLKDEWVEPKQIRVINFLQRYYSNKQLLFCKPEVQQRLVNLTDSYFEGVFFNNGIQPFGTAIIKALRYNVLQKHDAYKISNFIGLKVCPYCNASLTVNIKKNKPRYQLDHFFPISKYPYLAISFFNLIPSCGQCNQIKRNTNVRLGEDFHLYSSQTPENAFLFKLRKDSLLRYLTSNMKGSISFDLKPMNRSDDVFVKQHEMRFGLQGLYETQTDIIEELVWKSICYNTSRIDELSVLLNVRSNNVRKMILGNYTNYEDIHKRPLAKFTQDIAKDLNLIK